jgi:hypothetical protein
MTAQEIQAIKLQYAHEDLQTLKDSKCQSMAITNTRHGVVNLSIQDGKYYACNSNGHYLIGPHMNDKSMINWIASIYTVEIQ